jgi:hypothetical protein
VYFFFSFFFCVLRFVLRICCDKDGTCRSVLFYLSGDWKFLSCVKGVCSPKCQDFFCIWCDESSEERKNTIKVYKTIDENRGQGDKGIVRKDLFPFIPMPRVVIDTLHLLLRITDTLMHLLFQEVWRQNLTIQEKVDKVVAEMTRIGLNNFKFFTKVRSNITQNINDRHTKYISFIVFFVAKSRYDSW